MSSQRMLSIDPYKLRNVPQREGDSDTTTIPSVLSFVREKHAMDLHLWANVSCHEIARLTRRNQGAVSREKRHFQNVVRFDLIAMAVAGTNTFLVDPQSGTLFRRVDFREGWATIVKDSEASLPATVKSLASYLITHRKHILIRGALLEGEREGGELKVRLLEIHSDRRQAAMAALQHGEDILRILDQSLDSTFNDPGREAA